MSRTSLAVEVEETHHWKKKNGKFGNGNRFLFFPDSLRLAVQFTSCDISSPELEIEETKINHGGI